MACLSVSLYWLLSCGLSDNISPMTDNRTNPNAVDIASIKCCTINIVGQFSVRYYFINTPIWVSRRLQSTRGERSCSETTFIERCTRSSCGHGTGTDPRPIYNKISSREKRAAQHKAFAAATSPRNGSPSSDPPESVLLAQLQQQQQSMGIIAWWVRWQHPRDDELERIIIIIAKNFFAWNWTLAESITVTVYEENSSGGPLWVIPMPEESRDAFGRRQEQR